MLLYHSLTSPYARKVRIVLHEKGLPFDGIDVATSTQQPSLHNPLGKVPTLVLDDGTVLFDSTVITEALDALYPIPRLIPADPLERAVVRRWEALADGICDVVIPVILDARRVEAQRDPIFAEKQVGKVRCALTHLEGWLQDRRYVFGDGFTLADVAVVSALGYLNLRRPDLLEGYSALSRYVAAQLERESLSTTIAPNLPVRG